MDTPLVTKVRGSDRYVVRTYRANGTLNRTVDITDTAYSDLALPGATRPAGVNASEKWDASGSMPDYEGSNRLAHAEIAELSTQFELGVRRRDGRVVGILLRKSNVTVDRTGGLTITPITSWPAGSEIVSITSGVLRNEE